MFTNLRYIPLVIHVVKHPVKIIVSHIRNYIVDIVSSNLYSILKCLISFVIIVINIIELQTHNLLHRFFFPNFYINLVVCVHCL